MSAVTSATLNCNASSGRAGVVTTFAWTVYANKLASIGPHVATLAALAKDHDTGADLSRTQVLTPKVTVQVGTVSPLLTMNWALRTPANHPSARCYGAMAYDSVRNRTVLFGGTNGSSKFGDTWEYDGSNWTQIVPANSPSARHEHAAAYDSARKRVLVFGGLDASGDKQDLWAWDGANWTDVTPGGTKPSIRRLAGMTYDSARDVIVLFGGSLDETYYLRQRTGRLRALRRQCGRRSRGPRHLGVQRCQLGAERVRAAAPGSLCPVHGL